MKITLPRGKEILLEFYCHRPDKKEFSSNKEKSFLFVCLFFPFLDLNLLYIHTVIKISVGRRKEMRKRLE